MGCAGQGGTWAVLLVKGRHQEMCTERTCGYHWGDQRSQAPGGCDLPVLGGGLVAEAGGRDVGLVHLPTSPVPLLGYCRVWGRLHLWSLEVLRGS